MAKADDTHETIKKQALENGWPEDLAEYIADRCADSEASAPLDDADEIACYCSTAGYPRSVAADFVLLGFTPAKACEALLTARRDKQALTLHLRALRLNQQGKSK